MELEFDKEIDAILRRSRGGIAVTAHGEHLDADAVAAFAEGALPERVRPLYTRHLADCDRCRKLLSQAIAMNTAAPLAADVAASSVDAIVGGSSWISNLFRTPSFAVAMGALVLVFGAALGYVVLRDQASGDAATVSQSQTEMQKGGPYAGIETNELNANSNAAATAANTAANVSTDSPGGETLAKPQVPSSSNGPNGVAADEIGRDDLAATRKAEDRPVTERDKGFVLDGVTAQPKPEAAPPPGAAPDKTAADREQEKLKSGDYRAKEESKNEVVGGVRQDTEDRMARGNVATAKKKDAGPTRSGPVQSQSQINTQTYEMPVTRTAGGKKFTNRSGAWYDTAYRGQPTTNVRRGTDTYKNLDSGLRSIADTLGGTVVVVWKDKAYRIQ